jgi:hypothetical protein
MRREETEQIGQQQGLSAGDGARTPAAAEFACEAMGSGCASRRLVARCRRAGGAMWWPLRSPALRCRLTALILLIDSLAVLAELGFLVLYQSNSLRDQSAGDASAIAGALSTNAATSLDARDRAAAQAALDAVALERQVLSATLFDREGNRFVEYRRSGDGLRPRAQREATASGSMETPSLSPRESCSGERGWARLCWSAIGGPRGRGCGSTWGSS